MKKVINIILLVVLGVSLSGCEWFEHDGGMKPFNNSESYDEAATNLITHGGSGKLYSNNTLIFKGNVLEVDTSSTMDLDFKIIVKDLDFNFTNAKNIIKIQIGDSEYEFSLGGGTNISSMGEFKYSDGLYYGIEDIKMIGDYIYIAFVNYSDLNNNATFDDPSYYDPILSSGAINDSISGGNYEETYIDFGNGLAKQCYIINHKIYTKSMLGDRWIYLAEMQSPIGYITTTTVHYMIGSVKIDYDTDNGFADKNKVWSIIKSGYKKYRIDSKDKRKTIML